MRDVAPGLWIWRIPHPGWKPGDAWEPVVTSAVVEPGDAVLVLDPLAPPDEAREIWDRLDVCPPTAAVVLKPDHVRDGDCFRAQLPYSRIPAYGPSLFWRDDIPEAELIPIEPGSVLPGGPVALHDGRGKQETRLWLPRQKKNTAIVRLLDARAAPK